MINSQHHSSRLSIHCIPIVCLGKKSSLKSSRREVVHSICDTTDQVCINRHSTKKHTPWCSPLCLEFALSELTTTYRRYLVIIIGCRCIRSKSFSMSFSNSSCTSAEANFAFSRNALVPRRSDSSGLNGLSLRYCFVHWAID